MASDTRRASVSRLIGTSMLTLLCESSVTTETPNWYSDSTSIPDMDRKVNTQFIEMPGYSAVKMGDGDSSPLGACVAT